MIPRYTRPEAATIWSPETRFALWLRIELAACEAMHQLGTVPQSALETIKKKASFDIARIDEIEQTVKHDVIAFLTSVNESIGPESRYLHMGMTSSDVIDTAFACQLVLAADVIVADIDKLLTVLKRRAMESKTVVVMGRSHGIHAEPTTFGLKFAQWYAEMVRQRERVIRARHEIAVGKISGAVGTYAHIDPFVETYVCSKLGLVPETVATQVVQRDRHAAFFSTLAVLAGTIEKIAVEIRHCQRTEVLEAEEPFTPGQKGSSAMPHKRNPILSENLTGLARLVRSNAMAALENVALWHERDISHSSVERVIGPDSCILIDFMLHRLTGLMDGLVLYPENMQRNIALSKGLIFSQRMMLALIEKGMTREEAYEAVQRHAMVCWKSDRSLSDLLKEDKTITQLIDPSAIDGIFNPETYLNNIDVIFNRVFNP